MTSVLLISQFILCVLLTLIVLAQKSSSIGLGAYSGSNESLFGARGPSAFLAKATAFIGLLLVANSISLTYLYYKDRDASVIDSAIIPAPSLPAATLPVESQTQVPSAPKAPAVPAAPTER